ncbi:MAG: IPT/TIG domain-containing protein, partial [Lentisphaeria bacterium]|nr:IPT/TIG domain-containing protein [Lentisphaeria bacterium]
MHTRRLLRSRAKAMVLAAFAGLAGLALFAGIPAASAAGTGAALAVPRPHLVSAPLPDGRVRVRVEAERCQAAFPDSPLRAELLVRRGEVEIDAGTPRSQMLDGGRAQWTVALAEGVAPDAGFVRVNLYAEGFAAPVSGCSAPLLRTPRERPAQPESKGFTAPPKSVLFVEGFETGAPGWTSTVEEGIVDWGVVAGPQTIAILNPEINPTLVSLPDSGYLPSAKEGSRIMWFGDPMADDGAKAPRGRGTFLGLYNAGIQADKNGGRSTDTQTAMLLSPPIDMTAATEGRVSFWTWWEAEGVDIADGQYDQMELYAVVEGTDYPLGSINPLNDVDGESFRPYSSGGLGQPGTWLLVTFDLSDYVGNVLQIGFRFDSRDNLYNGFRGWAIDGVTVSADATPPPIITDIVPPAGVPGDLIVLYGENFVGGADVYLDGILVTSAVVSTNLIQFEVPSAAVGFY